MTKRCEAITDWETRCVNRACGFEAGKNLCMIHVHQLAGRGIVVMRARSGALQVIATGLKFLADTHDLVQNAAADNQYWACDKGVWYLYQIRPHRHWEKTATDPLHATESLLNARAAEPESPEDHNA